MVHVLEIELALDDALGMVVPCDRLHSMLGYALRLELRVIVLYTWLCLALGWIMNLVMHCAWSCV